MKRTTVTLTDELAVALEREAGRLRVSASQVTRDALAAHLGVGGEGVRPIPFAAPVTTMTRPSSALMHSF